MKFKTHGLCQKLQTPKDERTVFGKIEGKRENKFQSPLQFQEFKKFLIKFELANRKWHF